MFKGCFVALVTPFRDGSIDFAAMDGLVEHVIEGGVHGLVPCGTTGESPTLSADEQQKVIAAVVNRARGRVKVIAGAGSNSTATTLAYSLAALNAGVDGVMLVAPYYNKPSQQGLSDHFGYVASRIDAPIMLYNIPGRCGVEISPQTIARLHVEHPNIVAVKHATGSIDTAGEIAELCDIAILSGDDTLTLPLMSVGAVGVVSVVGNLVPRDVAGLVESALASDFEDARLRHRKLFPLCRDLLKLDTNPIPIKTALAMRRMMAEEFRLPMCPMAAAQRQQLQRALVAYAPAEAARQTA